MPFFMDRHENMGVVTAEDIAYAHLRDLEVQDKHGVRYTHYWFDPVAQTAFCFAEGPSRTAVEAVHRESHGLLASKVIEVDGGAVDSFFGQVTERRPGEPYAETAFRTILFTDIEGSTSFTQRLGDSAAMQLLRVHDTIVRAALRNCTGHEVKHTGDGIMASFASVSRGLECAIQVQRSLQEHNRHAQEPIGVRIGVSAGEPVTENDDLFGAAVQLAARLCGCALSSCIVVSSAVRELAIGKGFRFADLGSVELKGFDEPVRLYEVTWRDPIPSS
jgi:class 3 adenylate cyclase